MRSYAPLDPGLTLSLADAGRIIPANITVAHSNGTGSITAALEEVLLRLKPIINDTMQHEAIAYHVIDKADLNPPLQFNEVIVLACGVICQSRDIPLTYNEVVDITDQIRGRPMNIKSIYNSIDSLTERGLFKEGQAIKREHTGRPSRSFQVTEAGRNIFAIAAMYNDQLVKARSQPAA